ncbi:MAG: hypothetical protein ACRDH2_00370 [Anaerolineales bacterium]
MAVKLLMSWDIKPGQDQEYFEFMVREWVPGLQRLGLEPTDAWLTMYGSSPQILTGGTAKNLKVMQQILETEEWQALKHQLLSLVDNYDQKVIKATGGFQL